MTYRNAKPGKAKAARGAFGRGLTNWITKKQRDGAKARARVSHGQRPSSPQIGVKVGTPAIATETTGGRFEDYPDVLVDAGSKD